ncbi:WYL domain-containing protein [Oceanisphaera marina]|uniref:WYL domain-containing protein n=1 Tax=Oceanisphaera marina TaxID=2017550 RepID=A0ABQ1IM12_9GAMM|nr:WYL domain-containing protein [Oceanisphaera marina]GGB45599.1 WYL domain-containing protein [Oceanisphaera marina]
MIKTTTERRFWLIELLANWEGRITNGHLQHYFQLGRQQASKVINQYQDAYADQLMYCASAKSFLPTPTFKPEYISIDVAEYLNWISGQSAHLPLADDKYQLAHAILAPPARKVSPHIMRPLVQAIRQGERLEVDYGAVSNPDNGGRIIVPIRFVNTGRRWHLRAWCEKAQDYRDFVLSRLHGIPSPEGKCLGPLPADTAWQTQLTLRFKPDPRLTDAQQAALIHDYDMTNGELILTTRAALAHYLLQEMQVNIKMLDGNPAAQQLILLNHDEIKPWLFT